MFQFFRKKKTILEILENSIKKYSPEFTFECITPSENRYIINFRQKIIVIPIIELEYNDKRKLIKVESNFLSKKTKKIIYKMPTEYILTYMLLSTKCLETINKFS